MSNIVPGLLAALLLCGCSDLAYYAQAVDGHLQLVGAARPIQSVLDDPETAPELRRQLVRVNAIRDFASRELALPENGSYRSYADLTRPFALWNVFAAEEFAMRPMQWCTWPIGCVGYRGYFDRAAADSFAASLRASGYDAYVGGVAAYSTLGFFSDPVLNTFLRLGEAEAARLIFHELAHQKVFASGDTAFNECFATTVENEGIRRWFALGANPDRARAFAVQQERRERFVQLVAVYRDRLRDLYEQALPPADKRSAKEAIFADMKRAYEALRAAWGGYSGYDKWFETDLNNAKLASMSLYLKFVPAFEAMLQAEQGDLPRFYQRVEELARRSQPERTAALNAFLPPAQRLAAGEPDRP